MVKISRSRYCNHNIAFFLSEIWIKQYHSLDSIGKLENHYNTSYLSLAQQITQGHLKMNVMMGGVLFAKLVDENIFLRAKDLYLNLTRNYHKDYQAEARKWLDYLDSFNSNYFRHDELDESEKIPFVISDSKKIKMENQVDGLYPLQINGFEKEGEPEMRLIENSSIQLIFNFMPPLIDEEAHDHPIFERFDEILSFAIGKPVIWDDREVFIVENIAPDTSAKLKEFLDNFWSNDLDELLEKIDKPKKKKWWQW